MPETRDSLAPDTEDSIGVAQAMENARILVVDDMALIRQVIGASLSRGGFKEILFAANGEEALGMIEQQTPDLIILDLNMPKLSGYEVCRLLRADARTAHTPILVQSASETPKERVEVFAAGATDFVSKPLNQPELLARVRMHLQNRLMISRLSAFHERMNGELRMARSMQQSLMPESQSLRSVEAAHDGKIEAFYKASFELGGDLWGCWELPGDKFGLFVLDISGHGVSAALNTFRVHATMARFQTNRDDPALFLFELNTALKAHFPLGQFATMFYAVLDWKTGHLVYAGAGAPRPMIIGADNEIRLLDSAGMPIGIQELPEYENKEDHVNPGESLFCYSDVLIEAPDNKGKFLGEDGLMDMVKSSGGEGPRHTLITRLMDAFFATRPGALPDDLTAVAIHRGIEAAKG